MTVKNHWGYKEQVAGVSCSKMSVIEVKLLHILSGPCVISFLVKYLYDTSVLLYSGRVVHVKLELVTEEC